MINEWIQIHPKLGIIIISIIVTIFTTGIRYFVTDRKLMKEIKEKQKWIREEMKKAQGNVERMNELNKQMMEHFPAQMKQTFKVMIFTFIPLIILFKWMRTIFATTAIASSWIWWYIVASMIISIALSKILKLD